MRRYRSAASWKEPLVKDGHTLRWEDAMAAFHDSSSRPGPATWQLGTYPDGAADLPVSGVSRYQAAADVTRCRRVFLLLTTGTTRRRALVSSRRFSGSATSADTVLSQWGATRGCRNTVRSIWRVSQRSGRPVPWAPNAQSSATRWNESNYTFAQLDAEEPFSGTPPSDFGAPVSSSIHPHRSSRSPGWSTTDAAINPSTMRPSVSTRRFTITTGRISRLEPSRWMTRNRFFAERRSRFELPTGTTASSRTSTCRGTRRSRIRRCSSCPAATCSTSGQSTPCPIRSSSWCVLAAPCSSLPFRGHWNADRRRFPWAPTR